MARLFIFFLLGLFATTKATSIYFHNKEECKGNQKRVYEHRFSGCVNIGVALGPFHVLQGHFMGANSGARSLLGPFGLPVCGGRRLFK